MYKVTITKFATKVKTTREYERLHDKEEFNKENDPQYGYVTSEEEVTEGKDIYTQMVEDLDAEAVIKAVLGSSKEEK